MINEEEKNKIEDDIEKEFSLALIGIKQLPKSAKKGVFLAYSYYYSLFKKIIIVISIKKKAPPTI